MRPSKELIEEAIDQIKSDFKDGDETALVELLSKLTEEDLSAFLPENPLF